MSRMMLALVSLLTGTSVFAAGQPVIESHNPPDGDVWFTASTEYVDIPGTEKMVTVPT